MVGECDFCQIARHEREARIVYESDQTVAFFPLRPAAVGHLLVITKEHVPNIWELDPPLGSALMVSIIKVSRALRDALHPDGLNIINSAGEAASQSVAHVHFHLVPRWNDDEFGDIWPPGQFLPEVVKDEIANSIVDALSAD